MVLGNISEGFYSLDSSNLGLYLFCHNSELMWHPMAFYASLADLINRERGLKRDRLEPEAFVYYLALQLTSVMGLG